jgi:uncharacterized membrane protein YoaK (UPF0700 family)
VSRIKAVADLLERELTRIETVLYFLAFACGIQNALCTTWSGAVVRTTHYTPTITDLGLVIGNWIREKIGWRRKEEGTESDIWKITVSTSAQLIYSHF